MFRYAVFILFLCPFSIAAQRTVRTIETDVLVIGGGTGGTAAAIQSARSGVKTILMEPTSMLGGMLTAAGVSCTDGNDQLPSGIWEEFRKALYRHYVRTKLNTGWVSNTNFEPHVGDSIFKAWASKEKNLEIYFGYTLESIGKTGNKVTGATIRNLTNTDVLKIKAKIIIDGTELGDVFARAGAGYDLGMDDPLVSLEKEAREKNSIIQDLTWAAILKDYGPGADKTIERPLHYNPAGYYCCNLDAFCATQPWNGDKIKMLNYGKLPRSPAAKQDKYMLNWPAHGNDYYLNVVEENDSVRKAGYDLAKEQTRGFVYFLQTELGMKNIGLADDELDGGMAWIPYNREGRRVKGVVRMNINHIKNPYDYTLYRTGIAVGDYPVDHHHAQYPGKVPEIEFPEIPAYNIPLGTLIPENIDGLIVCEKGISVTNIVNGTTRLQPVVLLTGQAAGILAATCSKEKKQPREINLRAVQEEILKAKCFLMPFVDVKPDDRDWEVIQKVGATGILKGVGKTEGWSNKMYFFPDSLVKDSELITGLSGYVGKNKGFRLPPGGALSISESFHRIKSIKRFWWTNELLTINDEKDLQSRWATWGLSNFQPNRMITRRELCVLLDKCILLFGNKNLTIDHNGKINFKYSEF